MLRHRLLTAVAIVVTTVAAPATIAQASTPATGTAPQSNSVEASSYYATPSELEAAGFSATAVAKQQRLISRMPLSEKRVEDARRATADRQVPSARSSAIAASTKTYERACDELATKSYKLFYKDANGNHPSCFEGTGTLVLPYKIATTSLQANAKTGRVLYSFECGECQTYWSTWRGPNDTKMYNFDTTVGAAKVYQVQLK